MVISGNDCLWNDIFFLFFNVLKKWFIEGNCFLNDSINEYFDGNNIEVFLSDYGTTVFYGVWGAFF